MQLIPCLCHFLTNFTLSTYFQDQQKQSLNSRKVVFQVRIPKGVAFSISYVEADWELPELALAAVELPN